MCTSIILLYDEGERKAGGVARQHSQNNRTSCSGNSRKEAFGALLSYLLFMVVSLYGKRGRDVVYGL